jgi:hypothetical protein
MVSPVADIIAYGMQACHEFNSLRRLRALRDEMTVDGHTPPAAPGIIVTPISNPSMPLAGRSSESSGHFAASAAVRPFFIPI